VLVLTRKVGERIVIGRGITVEVVSVQGSKVRLGIVAPPDVPVDREEVRARRAEFADEPTVVPTTHPAEAPLAREPRAD
jgi:carbon storage regulator